ncbi:MAG: peptidylprolyl isomerase [Pelagimonas sp.]|nr:peptidylprolyl isomerase [Pelagimonas sp.]
MKSAIAAIAITFALPALAQDNPLDRVVATVNGTEITLGHMLMARASLPEQYQQLPDAALWDGIVEQLVQQEALAQTPQAEETKRMQLALDNERRSLLAAEAVAAIAKSAVTDEAVQAAYDAEYQSGEQGREYNASHILVETEEAATAIVAELTAGADFEETAKEKSTGPTGPNGGSLGWFSAGMMVEPFQKAVEALQAGEISGPVKTQFGWHVIKLNESRIKEAPTLEQVRAQLEAQLQQDAVQTRIDELVRTGQITRVTASEIDPSILSNIDLLEQ